MESIWIMAQEKNSVANLVGARVWKIIVMIIETGTKLVKIFLQNTKQFCSDQGHTHTHTPLAGFLLSWVGVFLQVQKVCPDAVGLQLPSYIILWIVKVAWEIGETAPKQEDDLGLKQSWKLVHTLKTRLKEERGRYGVCRGDSMSICIFECTRASFSSIRGFKTHLALVSRPWIPSCSVQVWL